MGLYRASLPTRSAVPVQLLSDSDGGICSSVLPHLWESLGTAPCLFPPYLAACGVSSGFIFLPLSPGGLSLLYVLPFGLDVLDKVPVVLGTCRAWSDCSPQGVPTPSSSPAQTSQPHPA